MLISPCVPLLRLFHILTSSRESRTISRGDDKDHRSFVVHPDCTYVTALPFRITRFEVRQQARKQHGNVSARGQTIILLSTAQLGLIPCL